LRPDARLDRAVFAGRVQLPEHDEESPPALRRKLRLEVAEPL
jgi:hypothetical protein